MRRCRAMIEALANLQDADHAGPAPCAGLERSPMAINKAVLAAMRAAGKVAPDIRICRDGMD